MRFPSEHAAPVARASIVAALVPAATDPRLDYRINRIGLADLVDRERPPSAHPFGEHPPCHRAWRLNVHGLPHTVRIGRAGHFLVVHRGFLSLVTSCSAASLKAPNVSSQNPSNHRRNASIPRASTW